MKTIEQIALETNDKLDKPFFYDHGAIDFAKEFLAAWLEQSQEPVAYMAASGTCTPQRVIASVVQL